MMWLTPEEEVQEPVQASATSVRLVLDANMLSRQPQAGVQVGMIISTMAPSNAVQWSPSHKIPYLYLYGEEDKWKEIGGRARMRKRC